MIATRQIITKHLAIIILIFIIGAYLVIKAIPENSWDDWRVGSAQALLSIKYWSEDGFLKNYLLFLPQGYSKTGRYFDDQQLRQHARGTTTGGFIGKRLYYTHYPSGYLLPSTLLMKLGAENRFWFRIMEILFSLTGLVFLYWLFNLISKSRIISFLGVLYFGASTLFLGYADSLASQPLEEILRPLIIVLSILALNYGKKYLGYLIWFFYFALAIISYDSTIFIFAWLIGLDLIIARKIEWKKWLFWVSAPILAFVLQVFQNVWYLGWHDMFLDFMGAIKTQILGSRKDFFISHLQRLFAPFGWFFGIAWYLGILIAATGMAIIKFIKKHTSNIFDERFLYLAFFATLLHFLFFPSLFFHQARVVSVFGGLLVGTLTAVLIKETILLFKTNTTIYRCIVVFGIFILVSGLWFIQGKRTYDYIKKWPNNVWPAESISFDKKIKNLVSGDKVIFQMSGLNREIAGSDRYPMAASEDEYYTDAPILGFTNTNDLVRDFNYLKNRSEFPFSAIIIADKKENIEIIRKNLKSQKNILEIDDKFTLIIPE